MMENLLIINLESKSYAINNKSTFELLLIIQLKNLIKKILVAYVEKNYWMIQFKSY